MRGEECKHDGKLSVARNEVYAYDLMPDPEGGYFLLWESCQFEEGGEFQEELFCKKCGKTLDRTLSEIHWRGDD